MPTATAFSKLSPQHKKFVKAYLRHFSALRAYKEAGYSAASAYAHAYRLVEHGGVSAAITEALERAGITEGAVKCDIAEIAFGSDIADVTHFLDGTKTMKQLRATGVDTRLVKSASHTSSAQGESQRVEMYDRLAALDKLMRIMGMVTEKSEVTQVGPVHVMFDDGTPAERAAAATKASAEHRKASEGK